MKKGIFITATGTDVGKTYVSALLVKHLREEGIDAGYYKPALSGAVRHGDCLIPGDAAFVCGFAGLSLPPEHCVSYVFEEAVSPHLAANRTGKAIKIDKIAADLKQAQDACDFLVVEGCGGICCPLRLDTETLMLTDVIKLTGFEILVVADGGLGTINHTLLTVNYARACGIAVRGIVLNNFVHGDFMHEDNKKQIERLSGVPVIACVAHGDAKLQIDL